MAAAGLPDTQAVAIRTRVRIAYGKRAATRLRHVPGDMRLATAAGAVVFTPTTTRFLESTLRERKLAAREGRVADATVVVPAGSKLEGQLLQPRLGSPPGAKAERKRKRATAKLPDPLRRVLEIIDAAGLKATVDLNKPIVRGLRGHFRRVQDYGICLDAQGMDVHFLPNETRVFDIQPEERPLFDKKSWGQRYVSVKAGSLQERQVVSGRLRRLHAVQPRRQSVSGRALETPLGKLFQTKLPRWTVDPYNLLLLENGTISIRKNAGRLGVLRADRALFTDQVIRGDFLSTDGPWDDLDAAITRTALPPLRAEPAAAPSGQEESAVRRPSGWRPKSAPLPRPHRASAAPKATTARGAGQVRTQNDTRRRIDAVPDGVNPELAELVAEASRAIRVERNAAFAHEVQLRAQAFSVRYQPVEGNPPRLLVRFEVRIRDHRPSLGAIWLWTGDPLALVFEIPPDAEDEAAVWAIVLLAFRDLTVWPDEEFSELPRRYSNTGNGRPVRTTATQPERRLPIRRRSSRHTYRGRLDIAALRAHMVAGHKRWLPDGWEASTEKLREAAALGIRLEPGQTWVTGHTRGTHGQLSSQSVVWEPPAPLERLVNQAARRHR